MDITFDIVGREILDVIPIVMGMIRSEMRNQSAADLTLPQYRALLFIQLNHGSSLKKLAHHLGTTTPTTSKLVDGMVLKNLIWREPSLDDRRKITLILTAQGQHLLEIARNGTQARLAEVLSQLTPEEGKTVYLAMNLLLPLFLPIANDLEGKPL
jgi:DNA-binding MarR family transcriptional regulator